MKFDMQVVRKGRNIHRIGWNGGYLLVEFRGNTQQWLYGPNLPREEYDKLLRVPYPDKLFQTNVKSKVGTLYKCAKIGAS